MKYDIHTSLTIILPHITARTQTAIVARQRNFTSGSSIIKLIAQTLIMNGHPKSTRKYAESDEKPQTIKSVKNAFNKRL